MPPPEFGMMTVGSAPSIATEIFEPGGGFQSMSRFQFLPANEIYLAYITNIIAIENRRRPEIDGVRNQGAFGRTMAQPTRKSGWRPFTSHSNARGTSGTMPGKRCAISGGGVPTVSEARQTTTPPVSLNLAGKSQGVRSG